MKSTPRVGWDCHLVHLHRTPEEAAACMAQTAREHKVDPFEIEPPPIDFRQLRADVAQHLEALQEPPVEDKKDDDRR